MKFKKHIAILLVLMMALSTAGYCVFAADEIQANENKQTEEKANLTTEELDPMDSFSVTAGTNAGEATLAWDEYKWGTEEPYTYADSYRVFKGTDLSVDPSYFVERKGSAAPYTYDVYEGKDNTGKSIATDLTAISFVATGLEGWKTQTFVVQAMDSTNPKAQGTGSAEIVGTYPATVTGADALAGYNSVSLKWNAQTDAVSYNVYDGNGNFITNTTGTWYSQYAEKDVLYSFRVKAVNAAGKESQEFAYSDAAGRVRTYYNYIRFKKARTLKCHCSGKKIKVKFPKGFEARAEGYSQARYMFYYQGHTFYVTRVSVKAIACDYNPWVDYTAEEAQLYVNQRGVSSPTGWLIWANFYSQQVYVFTGYPGAWTCVNQFPCCSGKCSSPSPSGTKKIGQKMKSRHGRPYWSCYSSLNAFHDFKGNKERAKAGNPASNGCVRVDRGNAGYIYFNVPKKSTVIAW